MGAASDAHIPAEPNSLPFQGLHPSSLEHSSRHQNETHLLVRRALELPLHPGNGIDGSLQIPGGALQVALCLLVGRLQQQHEGQGWRSHNLATSSTFREVTQGRQGSETRRGWREIMRHPTYYIAKSRPRVKLSVPFDPSKARPVSPQKVCLLNPAGPAHRHACASS